MSPSRLDDMVVDWTEDGLVAGGRALRHPGETIQACAHVYYGVGHRDVVLGRAFEFGEDGVPDFKAPHVVLQRIAEGPVAQPDVLYEGYLLLGDAKGPGEKPVVQLDGPVLPVSLGVVHGVLAHHAEGGVVAAGHAHVLDVVEPQAHLGDDEGVGGEVEDDLPCLDPLEVDYGGDGEVKVGPPAGHDGVSLNARVAAIDEVLLNGGPCGRCSPFSRSWAACP